ncbi:MAG: flagellar basal body L-ring protein FlgH [Myxococcota bacterium]
MNRRVRTVLTLTSLSSSLAFSCGPQQIRPHTARERNYQPGEYEQRPTPVSDGSLWTDNASGLFADFQARHVGDLVTVRISESAQASGDASTDVQRDSEESFGIPVLFGLTQALQNAHPDINPSQLLSVLSNASFSGDGSTSRGSTANGSIAVRVKRKLPNGDLFIEGTKIILINNEELHIYVSGVIRPEDIEQDNSIGSSLIADAQIQFAGRGPLADNQRQGWLSRLLSKVRPL